MKLTVEASHMRALSAVVGKDQIRTYLNCIHITPEADKLQATDGHRLIVVPVQVEGNFMGKDHFPNGVSFHVPKKPPAGTYCVTIETGRNPERYEEITWTFYDKLWGVKEQLLDHLVDAEKFPDTGFITNKNFAETSLNSIGFNPALLMDVYTALRCQSGVHLLFGHEKISPIKVEFGDDYNKTVGYYVMPMRF
jgi:DNA polymerase III sliding clamp (beta) subunit (PCNA family)